MKNIFRKAMAMLIAFALLISSLPVGPAEAAGGDNPVIPDGVYPVQYRYVKDNSTETSAANAYAIPDTGRLIIQDGQATFEHEVRALDWTTFVYFASRLAGQDKAVISGDDVTGMDGYRTAEVRPADNPDNVVVSLYIEDVWEQQDILMHIWDKENIFGLPFVYNYWYNAQLELYLDDIDLTPPEEEEEGDDYTNLVVTLEMFQERATVAWDVYGNAREGTSDGFYPIGSRTKLYDSIIQAESLAASAGDSASLLKAAYIVLDQAVKTFESSRIVVDKSRLTDLIARASAWAATAKAAGSAETGVISDGEYPENMAVGTLDTFQYRLGQATSVAEDVYATQEQVNKEYNLLYYGQVDVSLPRSYGFRDVTKRQFKASNIDLLLLDSFGRDAAISPHAGDIEPTAVLLQQAEAPYYIAYANFTFNDPDNVLINNGSVRHTRAYSTGEISATITTASRLAAGLSDGTHKVYQANIRMDGVKSEING